MRLHTNILTSDQIREALTAERNSGRIAYTVRFKTLSEHKSQSHARAFEVQLESYDKAPGDGRRYGNSGSYGAGSDYTATYDEWGWLIAALYKLDPAAVWGSVRNPQYANSADFDRKTALTYNPDELIDAILLDGTDPYPYRQKGVSRVGREGAIRSNGTYSWGFQSGEEIPDYYLESAYVLDPRTIDSVLTFSGTASVGA